MFDNLYRVIKGNTPYISLNQIKQNLEENKERTELDECWLTPFYITPQRTYEFYYLKLIMNRNMPFDEFKKSDNSLKSSLPESIISQKRKCYINIDDSKSKSELAEELFNYLFYIETNEEIIDTVTRLFGSFDSNNIYFEYIE